MTDCVHKLSKLIKSISLVNHTAKQIVPFRAKNYPQLSPNSSVMVSDGKVR